MKVLWFLIFKINITINSFSTKAHSIAPKIDQHNRLIILRRITDAPQSYPNKSPIFIQIPKPPIIFSEQQKKKETTQSSSKEVALARE